jgi:hypothetical protein
MKSFREQNYYELLELPRAATDDEIRAAHDRLCAQFGDDAVAMYGLAGPAEAKELRARLLEAMEILTEADLRVEYDRSIGLSPLPPPLPPAAAANDEPAQPRQLAMTELLTNVEAMHSTFPQYQVSYIRHSAQPPARLEVPDEPVFNVAPAVPVVAAVAEVPVAPQAAMAPIAFSTLPAQPPVDPPAPSVLTPAQATPEVAPPVFPVAATPAQGASPVASPALPVVLTPPLGASPVASPALPVVLTPPLGASAVAASGPLPEPAAPAAEVPPAPLNGVAPVAQPAPPPPAAPATAAETPPSPSGRTAARGFELNPEIAPEAAIASAEAALAQVSAKVREPRPPPPVEPRPKPIEIPADAEFNGELLRQVRQSRGLSLEQLADRTRITARHLGNVEADRYDALPVTVYLRGILMNIARELGLDPLRVSKSYLGLVGAGRKQ